MKLSEINNGKTFNVAGFDLIKVAEDNGITTAVFADVVFRDKFGKNNNFAESNILQRLNDEILPKLTAVVGDENVLEFETDLTSLDGLRTHGSVKSKIAIPTFDFYRNNVSVFDEHKIDVWWWLATPDTTREHYNDNWIVCVSPDGDVYGDRYFNYYGVRPILTFVSDISVSCED